MKDRWRLHLQWTCRESSCAQRHDN